MDTAALIDQMVDSYNRHDTQALAACYVPDARIHPAGWPQPVDTGTWLAAIPVILTPSPTFGCIRATWPPTTGWHSWKPG